MPLTSQAIFSMRNNLIFLAIGLIIINLYLYTNENRSLFLKAKDSTSLSCNVEQLIELSEHSDKLQHLDSLTLDLSLSTYIIPKEIENFQSLKYLRILTPPWSYSTFYSLDRIGKLKNLITLDLSSNNFEQLPEEMDKLSNIETLILSSNSLSSLRYKGLFKLTQLKALDISNNPLTTIPQEIGKLKNLSHLALNSNDLVGLPASIGNLKKLKFLELKDTKIKENIPNSILELDVSIVE